MKKLSKELQKIMKALNHPDGECPGFKAAKAINQAYILEDG